jgi:hypothetical protein
MGRYKNFAFDGTVQRWQYIENWRHYFCLGNSDDAISSSGEQGSGSLVHAYATLSADGRYIVFTITMRGLMWDAFYEVKISGDGLLIVFNSMATNLTPSGVVPTHVYVRAGVQ